MVCRVEAYNRWLRGAGPRVLEVEQQDHDDLSRIDNRESARRQRKCEYRHAAYKRVFDRMYAVGRSSHLYSFVCPSLLSNVFILFYPGVESTVNMLAAVIFKR